MPTASGNPAYEILCTISIIIIPFTTTFQSCLFCSTNMHAKATLRQYSLSRDIGNVDKRIVETGKDMCHSKHIFPIFNLGSKSDLLFLFLNLSLSGCHPKMEATETTTESIECPDDVNIGELFGIMTFPK